MRALAYFAVIALFGLLSSCAGSSMSASLDDSVRMVSDDGATMGTGGPTTDPDYVFYNSEGDDPFE
ncbi:hypothetical protein JW859_03815 [bacterium]|nr:hypothetical protein [bacterium]